ncbi:SAM-dependent methyltransferase [Streptomyces sp. ACA25]|uniref:SAM-dependent methyltransferase n=1 Tax=Streptomyces sp. ACA25 TaxID=3022596 RepID=UPI0023070B52|nr:SAM-dependent methyltransferase [Streptomyces sp. ACA25]MDB1089423.1 SAM-dependent methyltransferase [Streptomyces sp. ACA25]
MAENPDASGRRRVSKIDTSVPHSARIWNYWLGGKDNYEIDRIAGDQYRELFPGIVDGARIARYFLARTIRYLAAEEGIRQFLDVGTGLPTVDNTHQVAQRVAPESRIVYVDNDPLVLVHAHALLTSTPEGTTEYIEADLHDPEAILEAAAGTLDFNRPVAVVLSGILGHVADYDEARTIVRRLMEGVPSGSCLSLHDATDTDPAWVSAQQHYNESGAIPYHLRSPEQIAGFFEGLELVEPGVVPTPRWRPEVAMVEEGTEAGAGVGGVGRKP